MGNKNITSRTEQPRLNYCQLKATEDEKPVILEEQLEKLKPPKSLLEAPRDDNRAASKKTSKPYNGAFKKDKWRIGGKEGLRLIKRILRWDPLHKPYTGSFKPTRVYRAVDQSSGERGRKLLLLATCYEGYTYIYQFPRGGGAPKVSTGLDLEV
ncbi:hypothetical protein IMZ48_47795 [Candidatus Bathyarchaeota archaeon]|nr:hypothetical protein [Candidatus Bathyarchaeota archaeon]